MGQTTWALNANSRKRLADGPTSGFRDIGTHLLYPTRLTTFPKVKTKIQIFLFLTFLSGSTFPSLLRASSVREGMFPFLSGGKLQALGAGN